MDISAAQYARLHDGNFEDDAFVADITAMLGTEPDHHAWREFAAVLGPGSVLEIGPGTGHVLAAARAAGRSVSAVEASASHRRFIRATWSIDDVFPTLDTLPAGRAFDNVIMVNVIEHVYDVVDLMRELRTHLSANARIFISTANARCIVGSLVGTYWAMFKERDHVSFPSLDSLARLADASGYHLDRRWSSELPLETPIGLMVAARDFLKDSRARWQGDPSSRFEQASRTQAANDPDRARKKRLLAMFYRSADRVDPSRHIIGAMRRAATVKGVFVLRP